MTTTARPGEVRHVSCTLCEAMCGLEVTLGDGGRVETIRGHDGDPLSRGHICPKAFALTEIQDDPDRLRRPLMRGADGELHKASWDEAIRRAARLLAGVQERHGDDALAAQIRASANPRLVAALEKRASQKKGIPLLSLQKETTERGDGLAITISVAVVPPDATAKEVLAQQRAAMGDNLEALTVVEEPSVRTVDGVEGSEIGVKYIIRAGGEAKRVASFFRVFVRKGLAYVAVAVFPEASGRGEEARLLLDGLHFYAPAP